MRLLPPAAALILAAAPALAGVATRLAAVRPASASAGALALPSAPALSLAPAAALTPAPSLTPALSRGAAPAPAAESSRPVPEPSAAPVSPYAGEPAAWMNEAWEDVLAKVGEALSGRSAPPSGVGAILYEGIDKILAETAAKAETADRGEAFQLASRLDQIIKPEMHAGPRRRAENLQTGLYDFAHGRTPRVQVDRTELEDHPFDILGLRDGDSGLRGRAVAAFARAMDERLAGRSDDERGAILARLALFVGWGGGFSADRYQAQLMGANEWTNFASGVSAYAIERLARVGTPEALAGAALMINIGTRTGDADVYLDEKVSRLLRAAEPAAAREAVSIALRRAEGEPFSLHSSHQGSLKLELRKLAAEFAAR